MRLGGPMRLTLSLIISIFSLSLWAEEPVKQSPDLDTLQRISEHNLEQAEYDRMFPDFRDMEKNIRPFAEYEKTGYLFFNDDDYRGYATAIKKGIAQNLPKDVRLVVYSTSTNKNYLNSVKDKYSQWLAEDQLIVLQIPRSGSNNFWTRDNLPLPVYTDDQFTLVDAQYYYNFEPDQYLIQLYGALSSKHRYFFEGGNFITNARGECIVVNRRRSYPGGTSDTAAIPDDIFKKHYGCTKLTRLRHIKGIGHSDEVVKFISDDVIVTDTRAYVPQLEALGYEVHMLPEGRGRFETYANSLQVNDTLFFPTFGQSTDEQAMQVYKDLNPDLKIVPLPTRRLAGYGQGGIHCITMNYPDVPMEEMVRTLGATIIK